MAYKTYILNKAASRWGTQIAVDGGTEFITFASIGFGTNYATGKPRFATAKKNVQDGIEASKYFEDGTITLLKTDKLSDMDIADETVIKPAKSGKKKATKDDSPVGDVTDAGKVFEPVTFEDVTTFRAAQAILTDEPYNTAKTSVELRTKEAILKKAEELGISFPNLK